MKQFVFAIEVLVQNDNELIMVRDPRSGQIVKTCDSPQELATFLQETITKIKTANDNEQK